MIQGPPHRHLLNNIRNRALLQPFLLILWFIFYISIRLNKYCSILFQRFDYRILNFDCFNYLFLIFIEKFLFSAGWGPSRCYDLIYLWRVLFWSAYFSSWKWFWRCFLRWGVLRIPQLISLLHLFAYFLTHRWFLSLTIWLFSLIFTCLNRIIIRYNQLLNLNF